MQFSLTLFFLHYYRLIWWGIFLLSALPTVLLINDFYTQQLGSNPLQTLQHTTGKWGLIFLLITLTVTPLRQTLNVFSIWIHLKFGRRLEDWNWLIRLRRMLGLYSFYYANLHMLVYVILDVSLEWNWARQDIHEKPYILLGVIAYLMLIPLAITSVNALFRMMGKNNWQRLHKTVYLIVILVIFHYWWQTKVGVYSYIPYLFITIFLLGFRLFNRLGISTKHPKDNGMEVPTRHTPP
ncbi:MAG: sulfoxide reductase heme-binding subunit YedZ [Gammaproteobacteria bacterium]|nr:sulfoxide reductase heme-binding subunit YedZ [Gammaproteobacteria bacterium]